MSYTAADVKRLREETHAGMLECKKALEASDGDFQAAVEYLRKKGLSIAASKSGRTAADGAVIAYVECNQGALIEINSETDFVARNEDFQKIAAQVAETACKNQHDFDTLKAKSDEDITHLIAKIKENIMLRRSCVISVNQGVVAHYIHNSIGTNMGKIGVLVALESTADQTKLREVGKKIAMHIAASKPMALTREDLSPEFVAKEREIATAKAEASGKPAEVIEKMVDGSMRKILGEVVLLDQPFVMEPKLTVKDFVEQEAKEIGAPIKISKFCLFVLGEGVERKEEE